MNYPALQFYLLMRYNHPFFWIKANMGNIPKKLAQFHWLQASLWKVFLLYPAKLNMFFVYTFMLKHCNYKT